jgi:hypothetical protein
VLLALFDPIKQRAKSGEFMAPGGHEVLKKAISDLVESFKRASRTEELGPKASQVLHQYQEQEVGLVYIVWRHSVYMYAPTYIHRYIPS